MFYYVVLPLISIAIVVFLIVRRIQSSSEIVGDNFMENKVVLEIKVPREAGGLKETQTAPLAAEHMFAALHGLLREDYDMQEHFTFEIISGVNGIKFYAVVPKEIQHFIESQIYAQYPMAQLKEVQDYAPNLLSAGEYGLAEVSFLKDQMYPIKTYRDFEVDPLSAITSSLSQVKPDENLGIQFVVRPVPDVWQEAGYSYVKAVTKGEDTGKKTSISDVLSVVIKEFADVILNIIPALLGTIPEEGYSGGGGSARVDLTSGQELELKSIESKLSKMGFEVNIRFIAHAASQDRVRGHLRALGASMSQFSTAHLNGFATTISENKAQVFKDFQERTFRSDDAFVLNIEELASVYHLPSSKVETPNIEWVLSKKAEPPQNLPTSDCTFIGETVFRSQKTKFGLKNNDDRLRHMYLIGKSGTGKSSLFKTMLMQDIANGNGVGVLDPHGELVEGILDCIPEERVDDVILIDPSDHNYPIGLNFLEMPDKGQKNLMASGLVSAIKIHFDYSWGPRLEYLLNYAILTLLEVPGTTMLGIVRLLTDMNYQKYILHNVKDPLVLKFWEEEYKQMRGNQRLVTEAVAPIQNKVNRFLASSTIRNILSQRNSTVDFWDAMNSGKILLMNLSKGRIGEDNANLLGALLVSRLQFMALQRAKIPSAERKPFYLYVDEFQNFTTGSFESILSESRKYGLGLYLTHQYTSQLPEELLKAVYGNVGTIASFSLGAPDAKEMAKEYEPIFEPSDIISLPRFHVYLKMMIDGMTSTPFSARILLPWEEDPALPKPSNLRDKIIASSRAKYGSDVNKVEEIIGRWVERPFDKGMAIAEEHRDRKAQEEE